MGLGDIGKEPIVGGLRPPYDGVVGWAKRSVPAILTLITAHADTPSPSAESIYQILQAARSLRYEPLP